MYYPCNEDFWGFAKWHNPNIYFGLLYSMFTFHYQFQNKVDLVEKFDMDFFNGMLKIVSDRLKKHKGGIAAWEEKFPEELREIEDNAEQVGFYMGMVICRSDYAKEDDSELAFAATAAKFVLNGALKTACEDNMEVTQELIRDIEGDVVSRYAQLLRKGSLKRGKIKMFFEK